MLILPYRCIYVYASIRQYKFTLTQITLQTLYWSYTFSLLLAMEWLFRPSLACLFRQLRFLTWLTGGTNSDKASWTLLLSMFSLPFGLSPCQFLSFLRHRQPFLQLTVHPVSGLNGSGGIFVLLMLHVYSRFSKRCQPPLLLHPLSTFHFKSVHAFFSFFR